MTRKYDTGMDDDYIMQLDTIIEMGFALRVQPVERVGQGEISTFGEHTRHGYFNMILHSDETTSYWGVRGLSLSL